MSTSGTRSLTGCRSQKAINELRPAVPASPDVAAAARHSCKGPARQAGVFAGAGSGAGAVIAPVRKGPRLWRRR